MQNEQNKNDKNVQKKAIRPGSILCIIAVCLTAVCLCQCVYTVISIHQESSVRESINLSKDGAYNSAEDVAAYIYKYGQLPSNYVTKNEAQVSGWIGGSIEELLPGHAIGGDRFYEAYRADLPLAKATGRYYRECDVNSIGLDSRGRERLLYSNDGLIYYSPDHYKTVTLLYGVES